MTNERTGSPPVEVHSSLRRHIFQLIFSCSVSGNGRSSAAETNALVNHSTGSVRARRAHTHTTDSLETRSASARRLLTFSVFFYTWQRYAVRCRLLIIPLFGSRPPGVASKAVKLGFGAGSESTLSHISVFGLAK